LLAFGALLLLVQFYTVLLRERTQDLRILRSMGAPKPLLAGTLVGELALASLLATAGGILLGLILGSIAANQTASLLAERLGVDLSIAPLVPTEFLVQLLVTAPLFVAVAAAPAIRRALSAELVED
jgi:ABC-type antimicrobial peptide transport system permease subunit